MKKSTNVLLSAFFLTMVSSCLQPKEWIEGQDEEGNVHDTTVDNYNYRYFRGGWFPLQDNFIRVPYYVAQSSNPLVAKNNQLRPGGFGSSSTHRSAAAHT